MRPKDASSEQSVLQILGAARRLLDEGGPQALSIRGVARLAQMSVGSVSYYFPSLEALIEACLDEYYARLWQAMAVHLAALERGTPIDDVLRGAARALYRFALQERAFVRLQLSTSAQRGGLPERRRVGDQRALLKTIIERREQWGGLAHPLLGIQTLVYTGTRLACASVEERCAFTGAESEQQADDIIAEYMAHLAVRLLGVTDRSERT